MHKDRKKDINLEIRNKTQKKDEIHKYTNQHRKTEIHEIIKKCYIQKQRRKNTNNT